MSQATTWGVPGSGPATPTAYAGRDNDSFDAVLSQHSGTSRPTYAVSGTIWVDVVSSTEENTYRFDGTDDILLYTINPTANTVTYSTAGVAAAGAAMAANNLSDLADVPTSLANLGLGTALPAFLATLSATSTNVTGNGANPTVTFDTEAFDQGSDFAANTFTAPVTGKYRFTASVTLTGMTGAVTGATIFLVTSNRTIQKLSNVQPLQNGSGHSAIDISALVDMDVSDTAHITVKVDGEAGDTVDILGTSTFTYFCGERVA